MRRAAGGHQPSKYRAIATVVDGRRFASRAEAARYAELKLLEKAKKIAGLECQPRYPLFVNKQKVATYIADFRYRVLCVGGAVGHSSWREVVEDVKGFRTPVYKLKKRMVEAQYQIHITEIVGR